MRLMISAVVVSAAVLGACHHHHAGPKSPVEMQQLQMQAAGAKNDFESASPATKQYFASAHAYAIFPRVTAGAIGIGGSFGHGVVYEGGKQVGVADITAANIGLSLGGQRYSEVIFFENHSSLAAFKSNSLEFDARASAVAASKGAGAAVNYVNGVRVFTQQEGGLMFEAAIGGQKFSYRPTP